MRRRRSTARLHSGSGISKIKIELDDLSLKYLEPEAYYDLVRQIDQRKSVRDDYVQSLVEEVRAHISKRSGHRGGD